MQCDANNQNSNHPQLSMSESSQGGQVQGKGSKEKGVAQWVGGVSPRDLTLLALAAEHLTPADTFIFVTLSIKSSKQDPKATIEEYRPEPSHHLSSSTPAHPRRPYSSSRIQLQSPRLLTTDSPPPTVPLSL